MIESLKVRGYKSLQNVELSLSRLNVFVGANASGKSSILQAILLLRQSAQKDGPITGLRLAGALYEAGTIYDVFHPEAEHRIAIEITDNQIAYDFSFVHDRTIEDVYSNRFIKAAESKILSSAITQSAEYFTYLNAERVGPRVSYKLPPEEMDLGGFVGIHGEYTTAQLARAKNGRIVDGWSSEISNRLVEAIQRLDSFSFKQEMFHTGRLDIVCNEMLGWIIPGARFEANEHDLMDAASLRYIRDPLDTKTAVRATHIGFGLTYTLPIIVAGLGMKTGGLLLVENPEAHLHPFSQSRIGVFLAMVASMGYQVLIETHSDHVLNGIRLAVSSGIIDHNLARVSHVTKSNHSDKTAVTDIRIDKNGYLDNWPSGFFDQVEKDLSRL